MDKIKTFFDFEANNGLFEIFDNHGLRPWEAVRYYVLSCVLSDNTTKNNKKIAAQTGLNFQHKIKKVSAFISHVIHHRKSTFLFVLCSRDQKNGVLYDKISDSLYDRIDKKNCLTIETLDSYLSPNYKYGKDVAPDILGFISRMVMSCFDFTEIYNQVKTHYPAANISLFKMNSCYKQFLCCYYFYKYLFKMCDIKKVFFVQNCIQKGLLAAANEKGITICELQHGQISYNHPAYSYPNSEKLKETMIYHPDYLLTFGKFWSKNRFYPGVKDIVLGNDSYAEKIKVCDTHSNKKLLVISNIKDGKLLAQRVDEVLETDSEFFFYFKLHPNQYHEYKKYIKRFEGNKHVKVISNQKSINELLNLCEGIFLTKSTVELEALRLGRKVFVLMEQDYEVMDYVLEESGVYACKNVESFLDLYEKHKNVQLAPREDLFEQFNEEIAKHVIYN